jgi:hypothetical protein
MPSKCWASTPQSKGGPSLNALARELLVRGSGARAMPMIDVYARVDLFPPGADRQLAEQEFAALAAKKR